MNPQPLLPPENASNKSKYKSQKDKTICKLESNPQELIVQETGINYSHYTNINQVEHVIIKQTDDKTFFIYKKFDDAVDLFAAGLIFLVMGIIFLAKDWGIKNETYNTFGVIFIVCCILSWGAFPFCIESIKLTLGPNNITIVTKTCLIKSTKIFGVGQLTKLEIITQNNNGCCSKYKYKIISTQNFNDASSDVCLFSDKVEKITQSEVEYFNYVMNHHIRTKMMHY